MGIFSVALLFPLMYIPTIRKGNSSKINRASVEDNRVITNSNVVYVFTAKKKDGSDKIRIEIKEFKGGLENE